MVATGWTSSVYCIKELQAVNVRAKHVSQHVILLYDFDASRVGDSSVFCDFDAKVRSGKLTEWLMTRTVFHHRPRRRAYVELQTKIRTTPS